MANIHLYSFILYNLVQFKISNVAVFHCWNSTVLKPMTRLLSANVFSQYIDLRDTAAVHDFNKRYLQTKLTKLGIFLDLSCEQSAYITNQSSALRLYTHNKHWLLYDEAGNLTQLENLFLKANLSINADITYVKLDKATTTGAFFTLYDVYNKGSHLGGHLNITIDQRVYCNRSQCEIKNYLSDLYKATRLEQRKDLSGLTFRLATLVSSYPLNNSEKDLLDYLGGEQESNNDWLSRLGYRSILHLQEQLHFNVRYTFVDQWSLNDYVGGAIGELVNETADLSTTPFVISPGRLRRLKPLVDLSQFRSICIFRTPHNEGIQTSLFLEPFKPSVWFVFFALLLVTGVLLWFTFRVERSCLNRCLEFVPSMLTSCMISFAAACIQGSWIVPRSMGGRVVFMALMFTSFLMYNYYTSIVVSILLGSPVRSNIKTIQQLADSSLDVGFEPIPFTKVYLLTSPRHDIRSLVKQKVDTKRDPQSVWLQPKDGVLKVRDQPGFVFVSEASFLYHFVEKYYLPHEICELNEIPFRPESNVFATVNINSTYKELLSQLYVRMLETGILIKHRRFFTKSQLHCLASNFVLNVGMEYTAPIFIILLLANVLALILLLLELAWYHYGKRKSTIAEQ